MTRTIAVDWGGAHVGGGAERERTEGWTGRHREADRRTLGPARRHGCVRGGRGPAARSDRAAFRRERAQPRPLPRRAAHDIRELQKSLARLGLSSLGRAETHVLAAIDAVLGILQRLGGRADAA